MKTDKLALNKIPAYWFSQEIDPPRRDSSFCRKPFILGGRMFRHGVGLKTGARIVFELAGAAESLKMSFGIDDETPSVCGVRMRLFDPENNAELFTSSVLRRGEAPCNIKFSLTGRDQIGIEFISDVETGKVASIDLLELEITYRGIVPKPWKPHFGIRTRNVEWCFSEIVPEGMPHRQIGLFLRNDGCPGLEPSELFRGWVPRSRNPELYNLPCNWQLAEGALELTAAGRSETKMDANTTEYIFFSVDRIAGIELELHVRAFYAEDLFQSWSVCRNTGNVPRTMLARDAVNCVLPPGNDPHLTTFRGSQYWELSRPEETALAHGTVSNSHCSLSHNSQEIYPGIFLSMDGRLAEEHGRSFAAALGWDGNWQMKLTRSEQDNLFFSAGALEEAHRLNPGEYYTTPFVLFSLSSGGAGALSRNFHAYMKRYGMRNGESMRPVVLNSWEGCFYDFDTARLRTLIHSAAEIGAEMFVLDDGWFGEGDFARNSGEAGLGDWRVNSAKLPGGLSELIDETHRCNMKFGLWFEPEMVNTKSRLSLEHPEWVIAIPERELRPGRGKTQLMLDLSRPEVEAFVYHAVADTLRNFPGIEYVKWDHNARGVNQGAAHLGTNQGAISDQHNQAVLRVMERLSSDFPAVVFQLCASGGGRADVGTMRFFDEFWCSDNSQGFHRIMTQWGYSHFFPAAAQASHVSARSDMPSGYKFRLDVAMSARLGVELCPEKLSAADRETLVRGIGAYKRLRPLIHGGELYRGRAPHRSPVTELLFVAPDKTEAVWFGFKRALESGRERIFASGLVPDKRYQGKEENPGDTPCFLPCVRTGREWMRDGAEIDFPEMCSSVVIKLHEVKL